MATLNVDEATLSTFRDAVFRKHKRLHGTLGDEAKDALLAHAAKLNAEPAPN